MWQLQRKLAMSNSATMTAELFQSAARNLILAVFGIYLQVELFCLIQKDLL